jgi:hypothetical protein
MTFGKPNRPSTPINGVMSNFYGETAAVEITDKYQMNFELVWFYEILNIKIEEANERSPSTKEH